MVPAAMLAAAAALGVVTIRRNGRASVSKVGLTEGVTPLGTLAQGHLEGTVGPSDLVLMLNPTAPREYLFDEDVPPGGRIVVNPDGSATVYDADGRAIGKFEKPWAYDALGRPQPTWYTVNDDDQLVQHIDPNEDAVYPILADPTFGKCSPIDPDGDGTPGLPGHTVQHPAEWKPTDNIPPESLPQYVAPTTPTPQAAPPPSPVAPYPAVGQNVNPREFQPNVARPFPSDIGGTWQNNKANGLPYTTSQAESQPFSLPFSLSLLRQLS